MASATLLDMTAVSRLVILGMAAAVFSGVCGTSEVGGRGGIIDCGLSCGIVFCSGDVGGVIGIGGLGAGGGNGGWAAVLRVSGVWVVFPVLLVTDFDSVEYFPFVPGCAASERVCSLSSCVMSTSSESLVSLRSCLVVSGVSCDVVSFLLGSSVLVRGLPSGRIFVFASLCKICSATVF